MTEPSPVRPNAGVRIGYEVSLIDSLRDLDDTTVRAVLAAYPSVTELKLVLARLSRTWSRRYDRFATALAKYFAERALSSTDAAFAASLRAAGLHSPRLASTADIRTSLRAVIAENVSLIRSIPAQYHTQVEGIVMRGVQNGRDLHTVSTELRLNYGVGVRRAALIARDQTNKANATFTRTRQIGLGIARARWLHSRGGVTPRPEHVAFSGQEYDVAEGALLDGKRVWPGTEINCRCVSVSIIPGLDR